MRSSLVLARAEHEVEQQRFVQRRRHFGDEDRVARVDERLRLVRQHGVHRVAELVREREHRVERVVVVHQHVRVGAVDRRRVGAAALALVLVDVDPALGEGAPHARLVLGAERRHRLHDPVEHIVVGVLDVVVDERHERVEDVVVRQARARACAACDSGGTAPRRSWFRESGSRRRWSEWRCRTARRRAWSGSRARAPRTSRRASRRCRSPRRC